MAADQNLIRDAPILSVPAYRLIATARTATARRRYFVIAVFGFFAIICAVLAATSGEGIFWAYAVGCAALTVVGFYMNRMRRRTVRINGLYALAHSLVQLGMLADKAEARRFAMQGEVLSEPGSAVLMVRSSFARGQQAVTVNATCMPPVPVTNQGYLPEVQPDGSTRMVPVGGPKPDGRYLSHVDAYLSIGAAVS